MKVAINDRLFDTRNQWHVKWKLKWRTQWVLNEGGNEWHVKVIVPSMTRQIKVGINDMLIKKALNDILNEGSNQSNQWPHVDLTINDM